jgi:hypothetical protein
MTAHEARLATFLLRLVDDTHRALGSWNPEWSELLGVAQRNGVLVRAVERLERLGAEPPTVVKQAVARERQRVRDTLTLVRSVDRACAARDVTHVFLSAFERYPDAGRDVDLLVLDGALHRDTRVLEDLRAVPLPRDVADRMAGAARYQIDGCELDVHHGRLGVVGEDAAYGQLLVRRRRRLRVSDTEFFAPSPEDCMVLEGMRRVYARRGIRLADVAATIGAVRGGGLDWDEIVATADRCGVRPGLCCYLSYVEQIHRDALGEPLLPALLAQALPLGGWGRVEFRDGCYRFPVLPVSGRLYLRKLAIKLAGGSWYAAARLCLMPVLGAAAGMRRLGGR